MHMQMQHKLAARLPSTVARILHGVTEIAEFPKPWPIQRQSLRCLRSAIMYGSQTFSRQVQPRRTVVHRAWRSRLRGRRMANGGYTIDG